MSGKRLRWLLLGLGLALVVVLKDYVQYARAHGDRIQVLQTVAARTLVRDKLVGRPVLGGNAPVLPGLYKESVRLIPNQNGLVVWIVDPSRCVDCFAELPLLRDLVHRSGIKAVIVLSGRTSEEIASAARRAGTVAIDTSSSLLERYGNGTLSGIMMYADSSGIVLAAEGYLARSPCDWRFVASVGALLGHIRSAHVRRGTAPSLARGNLNKGDDND